jgi:hypothetical protein
MRWGTVNGGLPVRTSRAHSRIMVRAPGPPKNGGGRNPRTRATTGMSEPRICRGTPAYGKYGACGTDAATHTNPSAGSR